MSNWSLIEHINQFLRRPSLGDPRQPTLWPSEASAVVDSQLVGKCRRAVFLRYNLDRNKYYELDNDYEDVRSIKEEVNNYTLWIFEQGKLYEDHLVELSQLGGVYISGQTPVYIRDLNISGKIDLICINPETSKLSIAEMKSVYGHGGNHTIGKPGIRSQGKLGTPRESHLMQLGIYHYKLALDNEAFEASRLLYGSRDTGRYAEYSVYLNKVEDDYHIIYEGIAPYKTAPTDSKISLRNMFQQYKYILDCTETNTLPPRDFDLTYSFDKIKAMYDAGELAETNREKFQKILEREEENKTRVAEGKAPKKSLKMLELGDYQCGYCEFRKFCYPEATETSEDAVL